MAFAIFHETIKSDQYYRKQKIKHKIKALENESLLTFHMAIKGQQVQLVFVLPS